ncbi:hypothetical protein CBS101457_000230 [Exobasidium rhododendri]|nr:hypothetical protein CBS101457_000230 [Exobasidium rhododendri]
MKRSIPFSACVALRLLLTVSNARPAPLPHPAPMDAGWGNEHAGNYDGLPIVRTRGSRRSRHDQSDNIEIQTARLGLHSNTAAQLGSRTSRPSNSGAHRIQHPYDAGYSHYPGQHPWVDAPSSYDLTHGSRFVSSQDYDQNEAFGTPLPQHFEAHDYGLRQTNFYPNLFDQQQGGSSSDNVYGVGHTSYQQGLNQYIHTFDNDSNRTDTRGQASNTEAQAPPPQQQPRQRRAKQKEVVQEEPIDTTFPITNLGFRWSDGNVPCYNSLYDVHKNMMIDVIQNITKKRPDPVRAMLRLYVTPFMALKLLSGDEKQVDEVIKALYPKFVRESVHTWRKDLSDDAAEALQHSLCRITGQTPAYILNFLTYKIPNDLPLPLSQASDEDLYLFAVDAAIMKGPDAAPVRGETVIKHDDSRFSPWMQGTTLNQRRKIVAIVKRVMGYSDANAAAYQLLARKKVQIQDELGLTILAMDASDRYDDEMIREHIAKVTAWKPRSRFL